MENKYTLKELHQLLLEMMKDFHTYCMTHHLKYYMVGGTLLGAARNQGFIPWDDDVDFAMPRPDYERFISTYQGKYRLEHFSKDNKFLFPYVKLLHHTRPCIYVKDVKFDASADILVQFDIYPIDGVGKNIRKAKSYATCVQKMRHLCYLNITDDKSSSIVKNFAISLIRLLSSSFLIRLQDKMMKHYDYNESNYVTRWRMPQLSKNIVEKDIFGEGVLLNFEDTKLIAPSCYHQYLTKVYGDYQIPIRENGNLRHDIKKSILSHNLKSIIIGNQDEK